MSNECNESSVSEKLFHTSDQSRSSAQMLQSTSSRKRREQPWRTIKASISHWLLQNRAPTTLKSRWIQIRQKTNAEHPVPIDHIGRMSSQTRLCIRNWSHGQWYSRSGVNKSLEGRWGETKRWDRCQVEKRERTKVPRLNRVRNGAYNDNLEWGCPRKKRFLGGICGQEHETKFGDVWKVLKESSQRSSPEKARCCGCKWRHWVSEIGEKYSTRTDISMQSRNLAAVKHYFLDVFT